AFAIVAAKRGISTEVRGTKSFFYLGGLVEGTETSVILGLVLLFPEWFGVIAVIFGLLCWLTTIYRISSAWQVFGKSY
ncbi:CDP-alcohol phosphatidyltransferase family protein, partial [bacterium]|nr:CDP-alcohol phosphatidyltransferase family protein [bacterium]